MKRTFFLAAAGALTLAFLFFVRESLAPLLLGCAVAYILHPVVKSLEDRGVGRTLAISCVYLIVILCILAVFLIGAPHLMTGLRALQRTISDYSQSVSLPLPHTLGGLLEEFGAAMVGYAASAAGTVFSTLGALVNISIGLVLGFHILRDREKIGRALLRLLPQKGRLFCVRCARRIDLVLLRFLTGQLAVAVIVAALLLAAFLILDIRYALLLALLAGALEVVPYFGAVMGAAPAVLAALLDSPKKALWTLVVFVAVQQLESVYISPKIVGGNLGVHPVAAILAVVIGGRAFGLAGMFLALPVCGIVLAVVQETIETLGPPERKKAVEREKKVEKTAGVWYDEA